MLDLLAEGLTNRQIAERLFLAEKTIKNYVTAILSKLGMTRRTEAAVYAVKHLRDRRRGLIPTPRGTSSLCRPARRPHDGLMTTDVARAIALTRSECRAVMATTDVGRIAISTRALPVIVPVCFVLDGDRIVHLDRRRRDDRGGDEDSVIAFEADGRPSATNRWSVHVTGIARSVTDPIERDRLEALPWHPGRTLGLVTMSTEHLSGPAHRGPRRR